MKISCDLDLEGVLLPDFLRLLLNPPKSYASYYLLKDLELGNKGCVEVERLGVVVKNTLQVKTQALLFQQPLDLVVFHHTPYHLKLFAPKRFYVYGKLEHNPYTHTLQMINPQVIDQPNRIELHFKRPPTNAYKQQGYPNYKDYCLSLVNTKRLEKLKDLGVPLEVVESLQTLFYPTLEFVRAFETHKGLFGKYLRALKFIEAMAHMLALSTKKVHFPSKFKGHANIQALQAFLQNLPFKLTPDQIHTIGSIQQDMQADKAAKRLVMGDVGCGKTIIILASVALASPYKSVLMAPTTILAKQIHQEALKFLPPSIKSCLFLGGSSKKSLEALDKADFIIGTTALLYTPFDTSKVALVLSDEQHRFGTKQRHALEVLSSSSPPNLPVEDLEDFDQEAGISQVAIPSARPHYLQFSATPIPRTLALMGAKFIATSIIKDKPYHKDIATRIIHRDHFPDLMAHIETQIAQDKQVAIIYPLVEESQKQDYLSLSQGAPFWQKHFKRVFITSGKDKNKEEVVENFAKQGDILLATTLIEVGISLPKLSTIIIVGAERLGLATLHQLRGRVARLGGKGYCYLFTHKTHSPRLEDFSQTLDGFEIANLDLKYRNVGDLLSGAQQSGTHFNYLDLRADHKVVAEVSVLF
ncbi:ATP-dependent DNA helicase RecG [Helicobacter bizzozeronii CCUG 35545]|nr:ATP-dependent DNA helicase RecG [Helicobacter bizzozeronii CCUG 35545]